METAELDLSNLDQHIQDSFNAIKILYVNKCYEHVKYCAYILIDQMAWLVSGSEQSVNVYFKNWIKNYFTHYYPEITAEEMWASRNGLLHNGSSISRDIENRKVERQLYFIDDFHSLEDVNDKFGINNNFVIVNTYKFIQLALFKAVCDFRRELNNVSLEDRAKIQSKLGKILKPIYPNS